MADYQMQKTIGTFFRSKNDQLLGNVRILGSWYDYKVIKGRPEAGSMLEVTDFTSRELLVVVNNEKAESEVNYIDNF
ncbi:hypothetical protein [Enterococcus sp. AZ109]|uniref:hypothetical protein n=1 Tax=Enterococcus sp. AZ109 TaxID=2774634 RepID=UPI003F29F35A